MLQAPYYVPVIQRGATHLSTGFREHTVEQEADRSPDNNMTVEGVLLEEPDEEHFASPGEGCELLRRVGEGSGGEGGQRRA